MKKLILASASPRRKELLLQAGAVFDIIPAKGQEYITKKNPKDVVIELAEQKAKEVAAAQPDENLLVLGADTVVALGDEIMGKPKDEADARAMLSRLSGNTHSVFTGVAVVYREQGREQIFSFAEETQVVMYPMSQAEIQAYVDTKEPMDKAGAYGIQGKCAIYIQQIMGDYNNVVGLPIARIYQEMKRLGIEIYGNS